LPQVAINASRLNSPEAFYARAVATRLASLSALLWEGPVSSSQKNFQQTDQLIRWSTGEQSYYILASDTPLLMTDHLIYDNSGYRQVFFSNRTLSGFNLYSIYPYDLSTTDDYF
jgi:hypothetical protein